MTSRSEKPLLDDDLVIRVAALMSNVAIKEVSTAKLRADEEIQTTIAASGVVLARFMAAAALALDMTDDQHAEFMQAMMRTLFTEFKSSIEHLRETDAEVTH